MAIPRQIKALIWHSPAKLKMEMLLLLYYHNITKQVIKSPFDQQYHLITVNTAMLLYL
jgi:hypothetical protein